jgi:hypothetical protein
MVDIFTPGDDKPHTYETLFHLENAEAVKDEATLAVTGADAGRANLAIIPANPQGLGVEIVKGQEKPVVQGWVPAKGYDVRAIPTPVYTRTAAGQVVEPYLLYPLGAGEANPVKAISFRDGTLAIQMADGRSHAMGFAIQGGKLTQVTWNGTAIKIR